MAEYQLALSNAALADEDDFFGIWVSAPETGLSFAANAPGEPSPPVWQIALPAQPAAARALLSAQQEALQRSLVNLHMAEQRLNKLDSDLSFSAEAGPEAELQAVMRAIPFGTSFSVDDAQAQDQKSIAARWRAFVAQVDQMLSQYARVETKVDELLIGHTAVGWTGDFETTLTAAANPTAAKLHRQAVQLALASRTAMLRLLIVISTGAAKLALRLAMPGAQILLLPAIYKFVRDVLKELRPLRAAI